MKWHLGNQNGKDNEYLSSAQHPNIQINENTERNDTNSLYTHLFMKCLYLYSLKSRQFSSSSFCNLQALSHSRCCTAFI